MRMKWEVWQPYLLEDAGVGAELRAEGCEHADHGAAAVDDLRGQTRERHGLCAGRINVSTNRTMTPFTTTNISPRFAASQAGKPSAATDGPDAQGNFSALASVNTSHARRVDLLKGVCTCECADIIIGCRPGCLVERLCVDASGILRNSQTHVGEIRLL